MYFLPSVAGSVRTIVSEIRGIPYFLLVEYLQELGGKEEEDGRLMGLGWEASLEKMEPFRLGSLVIGQVKVELKIEDALADEFIAKLSQKTLRAGG